ncbi:MAG: hypothetical protein IK082_06570 [Oscillospiraceae bacterium]|nr:hypothetical protein [Oscillospiraceae bacterium]
MNHTDETKKAPEAPKSGEALPEDALEGASGGWGSRPKKLETTPQKLIEL